MTPNIKKHNLGFTLIEVLVATAVALVLIVGLSQIFKVLGDSITKGRAGLELNNRLRNVALRIRTDLDSLSVDTGPLQPITKDSDRGYLKYYDGPMTDYSLSQIDPTDTDASNGLALNTNQSNPFLNRFGDLDDILMATIEAKDTWFTGKVPRFILEKRTPVIVDGSNNIVDLNGNLVPDEFDDLVTIASEFAEIVIFAQPIPTSVGNPSRDTVALAMNPTTGFEDVFSGIAGSTDLVPDGFRLYYRQLLIRPDLNLPSGVLPYYVDNPDPALSNPLKRAMVAGREVLGANGPYDPTNSPLPNVDCDMYRIHQYCDLSVRRINDFNNNTLDLVAANSRTDLMNQSSELTKPFPLSGGSANRFAHVQYQVPSTTFWTMPVLALGPALTFQGTDAGLSKRGFLHPAFTLLGDRRGEDLLASDVLAFDIKAFDPAAPMVDSSGIVLRPGDPGFSDPGITGLSATNTPLALGEFVDVDWGGSAKYGSYTGITDYNLQGKYLKGQLSGVDVSPALQVTRIDSLAKSGNYLTNGAGTVLIDQPCYDTFSDYFETDLIQHGTMGGGSVGVVENRATGAPPETVPITKPPFVVSLRGIQISIRLEDPASKQFKQMTTVKSFPVN